MVQILPEVTSFGTRLAQGLGSGIGEGVNRGLDFASQMSLEKNRRLGRAPSHDMIVSALVNKGVDPEDAELYSMLTQGGQTAFVKDILEAKKRSGTPLLTQLEQSQQPETEQTEEPQNIESQVSRELGNVLGTQDVGLTPAEKVTRGKERFSEGSKKYDEASTKLRAMARDKERLGILENLEKTNKLPKNLGRLNVNKEGNLRFPFAASPEAQRFVKTLNEFSAGAKDTFGSRVTNFDLQQYLLRFPNLLNSSEGRNQLYKQMKIVNDINSVYYKNLKNVYDKAGGVRNLDSDRAEALAEKLSESKIAELVKQFDEVGKFPTLPSAQEFPNRKIVNNKTGEVLQSNGKEWIPIGK